MRQNKGFRAVSALLAACLLFVPSLSYAQNSSSSANYRVDQTFFGSGGELNSCNPGQTYCAKITTGELGIGNVCSTSYCAWAGFNTTDDPFLEFIVTGSNIDLGYLNTSATATANGTFAVRAWQAGGYTVRTESNPPTNGAGHQLSPLGSPLSSAVNNEQFGINLVANTTAGPCNAPANFGQNPQQDPDGTFSFGQADADYAQCGKFKYAKGDRIAYSDSSTSITAYTVSYIFNINDGTPSGTYTFNHTIVATGTY